MGGRGEEAGARRVEREKVEDERPDRATSCRATIASPIDP